MHMSEYVCIYERKYRRLFTNNQCAVFSSTYRTFYFEVISFIQSTKTTDIENFCMRRGRKYFRNILKQDSKRKISKITSKITILLS